MIVTPLDSATLDSKAQYVFYHKMVDFALKELIVSVQNQGLCSTQEVVYFKQFCDLLLYSVEAMRIKYMYDDEDNMKVDLTDSGFPNYLEFRYLFNDLSLKEDYISKLKNVSQLQDEFLHELLHKKQPIKREKLFQAASIVYYTSVEQKYIFNRFVQGRIMETPKDVSPEFMTSWSFYDVAHNRPFICFMYFDYSGGRNPLKDRDKIYEVLKTTADRDMDLDTMAYGIDRKLPEVHPKHIKRIDLGPFHNVFAKDENEITHAILESIAKKELSIESYALSLSIDEVFSGSEFKEGSFFNKQTLQKWSEPIHQKYVFAPHRIIQMLYNKTPEIMNRLAKPPIQVSELKIKKTTS
ncbi:hypothetical protein DMZ43_06965 [Meridianimaribacter sp. CL38]|uniref:hypothetical protein n=1 Tax=Meridianimaribacter sp. CL38 TaxID=2213021 RepID=UPI00103C8E36|nr:hypothetical protein [Meridianimaribacter sp. CL38]TBV26799.1 hypothetical protein DMZ43_06965 [Meridianimaribacter sp. CL38]